MFIKTLIEEREAKAPAVESPVKKILKDARELLSEPNKWTKGTYAKTAEDCYCGPLSDSAAKFCSIGAVMRAANGHSRTVDDAVLALDAQVLSISIASFNDRSTTTHADILAVFDRTIEAIP